MGADRAILSKSKSAIESFFSDRPYADHLLTRLRDCELSQTRVLDLGCGRQLLDVRVFAKLGTVANVGVDMCEGTELGRSSEPVYFIRSDFDDYPLPFKDGSYDLVLMHNVIEHLHNPHEVLKEVARVLSSKGMLSIITENQASLKNRVRLLLGGSVYFPVDRFIGARDRVIKKGRKVFTGHVREYTESELRRMITETGLRVDSVVFHPAVSKSGRDFERTGGTRADSITRLSNSRIIFSMYHLAELAVPSWRYMMSVIARKI